MENTYHFLINPSYNNYGFRLRTWGTFRKQGARKGLVASEAGQRPLLSHRYLITSAYWSSKSSVYYFCFTATMRQHIKRGFQQAGFKLVFHVDGKKTYSSLFYTIESLRADFLKEPLQVLRAVEIIQGFLVAKIFPPICWVSTLKTLLILSCIWHRFPGGCGGLCGRHERSPTSQLPFPSSDNTKNIFKEGIPFNMQVVIPKMLQLLILFVTVSWNKTVQLILARRLPPHLKPSSLFLTPVVTELNVNTIKSKCRLVIYSEQFLWWASPPFRYFFQPALIFTHQFTFSFYVPSRIPVTDYFFLIFNSISASWHDWVHRMFCDRIKKSC